MQVLNTKEIQSVSGGVNSPAAGMAASQTQTINKAKAPTRIDKIFVGVRP